MLGLPTGEVELLIDGEWESVCFADLGSREEIVNEIMYLVEVWSKKHTVTAGRYKFEPDEAPVIYWKKED